MSGIVNHGCHSDDEDSGPYYVYRFKTVAEDQGRLDLTEQQLAGVAFCEGSSRRRSSSHSRRTAVKSAILTFLAFIILIIMVLVLLFPQSLKNGLKFLDHSQKHVTPTPCLSSCKITLVESIPEGLVYPEGSLQPSIYDSWLKLTDLAEKSIDIASFYWTLKGEDVIPHPSASEGEEVFRRLKEAGLKRGIRIRVAQNQPSSSSPDTDTVELQALGIAVVRNLDFKRLVGAGILHTKLWVVDGKHFFVGSANMDWRALTQVKELGAAVYDCPCLAEDASKLFSVYWALGEPNATVPVQWPLEYATEFNHSSPMSVSLNDTPSSAYLSSSPPQLCPNGRTSDIAAILHTMDQAEKYINIAVMDYIPAMLYSPQHKYWPVIDEQLRRLAVDKGVQVRLLVSHWSHSNPASVPFLRSLADISRAYPHVDVQVKIFVVPVTSPDQEKIPFARVNHNKYMVTDQAAYIGTSNWSGDYFINTGGVALVVNSTGTSSTLQEQLKAVFDRDWNSAYASTLDSLDYQHQ